MAATHVALLRAINVGGKNKVPMATLRGLFEAAGCNDVSTYIQSGNVLFSADGNLAKQIPGKIQADLEAKLQLNVPVIVRSKAQWKKVLVANPQLTSTKVSPDHLSVGFLAKRPTAARVKQLDLQRSPGDSFVVKGAEVYLHCPNGVARSKLTVNYFDSQLQTTMTARNWKTVTKLADLLGLT